MKWIIFGNTMVYPLLLLLSKKGKKKHDKTYKDHKRYRTSFTKPNKFYDKKKYAFKKYDKQKFGRGKYFNCGKSSHFSKDCPQKPSNLKNKLNKLNINDNDQEELFQILESTTLSDSLEEDFSSSSNLGYHSNSEASSSPNTKIGCRHSCCNTINVLFKGKKIVNILTKGEEQENLLITLISLIDNPELKEEYLKKLKKTLIKDENDKTKIQDKSL